MKTKWKPKVGERYYSVGSKVFFESYPDDEECKLVVGKIDWCGDSEDLYNYKIGNCFEAKKEAQAKLKKIKEILREN